MTTREKYVIVTAAGSGTRMGASMPKQFLNLGEKPVLRHTLEAFFAAIPQIHAVVVLSAQMKEYWRNLCYAQKFYKPQTFVEGGLTRFHSIKNALKQIPDDAVVAVHDGVRPLISPKLIQRLFDLAEQYEGVVPCIPSSDTLRCLAKYEEGWQYDSQSESLPAREQIFGMQTPQIFDARLLKAAYSLPYEDSFTDDASVVQAYLSKNPEEKSRVCYVPGEKFNLKLTTPDDMLLAEAILSLISK